MSTNFQLSFGMFNLLLFIVCSSCIRDISASIVFNCATPPKDATNIEIKETDPIGTSILRVTNSSSPVQWSVSYNGTAYQYVSSFFTLVEPQGQNQTRDLQLLKAIDLELLQEKHPSTLKLPDFSVEDLVLTLDVECQPEYGTTTQREFNIVVKSVNEFSPNFLGAPFTVSLSENAALGTEIFDLSSKAVDLDAGTSQLTYSIAPYIITEFDGSRFVRMDSQKNGRIVLSQPLDFENLRVRDRAYFFLNVTVTDEGRHITSTSVQVGIEDANDQSIEFVYPNCTSPCIDVNFTVYTNESYTGILDVMPVSITCRDLDTLNSTIEYLLVSDDEDFFSMDRQTGQLSKIQALANDSYGYNISLVIEVREEEFPSHSVQAEVTVLIDERKPQKGNS